MREKREVAWSTSQAAQPAELIQVHERRAQVVRDDIGKAPDLLVRCLQFGRTLLTRTSSSSRSACSASSACTRAVRSCTHP